MKPVDQVVFEERGDCMSACIASILELPLDDVPHFVKHDDWIERRDNWLRQRGLCAIHGTFHVGTEWRPAALHILYGKSPRWDGLHCVVARGHEILHDPHPSRAGIETQEGFDLLVPLDPVEYVRRTQW